jgi:alpha-1,3-glucosyltransferase
VCRPRDSQVTDFMSGQFHHLHVLVTAHPDDEALFFVPTIRALLVKKQSRPVSVFGNDEVATFPQNHCDVWLVCVTSGNYDGLGNIRKNELHKSAELLKITKLIQIDESTIAADHPHHRWNIEKVARLLVETIRDNIIQVSQQEKTKWEGIEFISFDDEGVSGHINHRDVCAVIRYVIQTRLRLPIPVVASWELASERNVLVKYFPIDEWIRIGWDRIRQCHTCKQVSRICPTITSVGTSASVNDFETILYRHHHPDMNWMAMAAHASQFLWYRRLFVVFSSYTYRNVLIKEFDILDADTQTTSNVTSTTNSTSSQSKRKITSDLRWPICRAFIISTCFKILLIPAYKSTDWDVHRHWKAVTRHISPSSHWYYDDHYVSTFHTTDYPPGFLWLEYIWSNNPIVEWLLHIRINRDNGSDSDTISTVLDANCFKLWNDHDNFIHSDSCVSYLRATVMVGDIVLWYGAWLLSGTLVEVINDRDANYSFHVFCAIFVGIVGHPALFWLDHVHFQYNGLLLGVLLASISCLLRARISAHHMNTTARELGSKQRRWRYLSMYHRYSLTGAALFAGLLTMKHLYLTLAPWYFVYLLGAYVIVQKSKATATIPQLLTSVDLPTTTSRLLVLGTFTVVMLVLPLLPLLMTASSLRGFYDHVELGTTSTPMWRQLVKKIFSRLFPFGRGLVHDYWAANIWALYSAFEKVLFTLGNRAMIPPDWISTLGTAETAIGPGTCLVLWIVALLPALVQTFHWSQFQNLQQGVIISKSTAQQSRSIRFEKLLLSLSHVAFSSFLTMYHVHEKAILTTLLPLVGWVVLVLANDERRPKAHSSALGLWISTNVVGSVGIGPLLYRPNELFLKIGTGIAYFSGMVCILNRLRHARGVCPKAAMQSKWDVPFVVDMVISTVITITATILVDMIPMSVWGRYEFASLALTSVGCAVMLLINFVRISWWLCAEQ